MVGKCLPTLDFQEIAYQYLPSTELNGYGLAANLFGSSIHIIPSIVFSFGHV